MEEGGGAPAPAASLAVQWERLLPRRSLRLLLVEYDDSTRHIVAALLRKCSYIVAAVADGMKAWEVMKEKNYNFDLVLAEVDMPSLSGLRLLTKIMATEECKNIPVIMMSSHDSMGLVHKCMLKGAVDCLLKPVRKNELRNLWQHVWRRHCSGRFGYASDNNASSNCISANNGGLSKTGIKSIEKSDAQSSGSKPDNELISSSKPKEAEIVEQGNTYKDTEAQEEQPLNGTTVMKNVLEADGSRKGEEGKSVAIGVEIILPVQNSSVVETSYNQNHIHSVSTRKKSIQGTVYMTTKEGGSTHHGINQQNKPLQGMLCFVKSVSDGQSRFAVTEENFPSNEVLGVAKDASHAKNGLTDPQPEMELSVRGPLTNSRASQQSKEKHILIHSSGSAFSRYGERMIVLTSQKVVSSTLCIRRNENGDKCHSEHNYGGDGTRTSVSTKEMLSPRVINEGKFILCHRSDDNYGGAQVSYDAGRQDGSNGPSSTGEATLLQQPQVGFVSVPIPVGMAPYQSFCANYGTMLQLLYNPETSVVPHGSDAATILENQTSNDQTGHKDLQQNACPQKEGCDPYCLRQQDDAETGHLSGLQCSLAETANQSSQDFVNGVGSNCSGENADAAGNTVAASESGNEGGVQNCNKRPVDSDCAHREAALMKFRLKRKERCFEKRVRYISRKKLAEQRPRVKGQFVRQKAIHMTTATEANDFLSFGG